MKIETPENYEARSFLGNVEVRAKEDGTNTIVGMAAVFDKRSDNLGGFREVILPGAFDDTDMSDVRGLFNHDPNFVLGRNKADTLKLTRTKEGLQYEIDAPDTQTIRDLVVAPIKRGDVDQSSFGFIVGGGNDEWSEDEEGVLIRTIRKFQELFDVSPVTFPAYRDTAVGVRSRDRYLENQATLLADAKAAIDERHSRGRCIERIELRTQIIGM